VLRAYAVVRGKTIGSILLCEECAGAVTPLNPDPLDVQVA
jgi:hypothetical protein